MLRNASAPELAEAPRLSFLGRLLISRQVRALKGRYTVPVGEKTYAFSLGKHTFTSPDLGTPFETEALAINMTEWLHRQGVPYAVFFERCREGTDVNISVMRVRGAKRYPLGSGDATAAVLSMRTLPGYFSKVLGLSSTSGGTVCFTNRSMLQVSYKSFWKPFKVPAMFADRIFSPGESQKVWESAVQKIQSQIVAIAQKNRRMTRLVWNESTAIHEVGHLRQALRQGPLFSIMALYRTVDVGNYYRVVRLLDVGEIAAQSWAIRVLFDQHRHDPQVVRFLALTSLYGMMRLGPNVENSDRQTFPQGVNACYYWPAAAILRHSRMNEYGDLIEVDVDRVITTLDGFLDATQRFQDRMKAATVPGDDRDIAQAVRTYTEMRETQMQPFAQRIDAAYLSELEPALHNVLGLRGHSPQSFRREIFRGTPMARFPHYPFHFF